MCGTVCRRNLFPNRIEQRRRQAVWSHAFARLLEEGQPTLQHGLERWLVRREVVALSRSKPWHTGNSMTHNFLSNPKTPEKARLHWQSQWHTGGERGIPQCGWPWFSSGSVHALVCLRSPSRFVAGQRTSRRAGHTLPKKCPNCAR